MHITGIIPEGLPSISRPSLRFRDVDGVLALAFACFLMGYIETISAARTFALKNNYNVNPRQELLSLGAANFAAAFSSAYVVAGGLSQSTVNDKSGAKTPMSLIICSVTLGVILLFFTSLLKNLPEVILAVIVIHAVSGLIKIKELKRIRQLSRMEFNVALIAIAGVLVFGILKGVMISVIMSLILLIRRSSRPEVAGTGQNRSTPVIIQISYVTPIISSFPELLLLRIESSILYFNAEDILEKINGHLKSAGPNIKVLILDLAAAPYVDVSGSKMLLNLATELQKEGKQDPDCGCPFRRAGNSEKAGLEEITGKISRSHSIAEVYRNLNSTKDSDQELNRQIINA